jgi:predicted amidohydrolase YtcJ
VPGDQIEFLYPVKSMLEHGLLLGAGSDFPIVDPNPWVSIHAAVTQQTEEGAVFSQQRMGVLDAIRMHTVGAAAVGFEEGIKGSLSPGKLADIVLLSENPFAVDPDQLKNIRVVMTILGGQIIPDSRFQIPD